MIYILPNTAAPSVGGPGQLSILHPNADEVASIKVSSALTTAERRVYFTSFLPDSCFKPSYSPSPERQPTCGWVAGYLVHVKKRTKT